MDLDSIAQELYGLPPEEFTATRNAQAKKVRAEGDRGTATRIAALRKPTVAAWAVNQLVRQHADEVDLLLDLGEELRAGMRGLSGDELRTLTKRRHALVSALVGQAQQLASDAGRKLGPDAAAGVRASLEATLADQASADALRQGCLADPLDVPGFGFGGLSPGDDVGEEPSLEAGATVADLDAHRQRKEKAIAEAEDALAEAERSLAEAQEAEAEAADRLAKAGEAAAEADASVARLAAELNRAEAEAQRRGLKADKRRSQHDEAAEALEVAEEAWGDARARLSRLTGDKN